MRKDIIKLIRKISARLTSQFFAGLIVILPLFLSIIIIIFLLTKLDNILGPIMAKYIGMKIPGIGVITLVVGIWLIGFLTTNFLGKKIVGLYESVIHKIPILNTIFGGLKQISDTVFAENNQSFRTVVLVNLKPINMYAIGFLSDLETSKFKSKFGSKELIHVFVPTTPNPTSGFIFLFPVKDVLPVDVSVEDGFKAVISLGVIHPKDYLVKKMLSEKKK